MYKTIIIVIAIFGSFLLWILYSKALEYGKTSNTQKNKKYQYTILIKLVDQQEYEINLYVNQVYVSISDLLKHANILAGKKMNFVCGEDNVELSLEKILLMKMQRKNLYKQCLLEKREEKGNEIDG